MDSGEKTFEELLTFLRNQKDVTLRELTRMDLCFITIPERC